VPVTPSRAAEINAAGQMPDLRGLSAREALRTLTQIGLTARISGSGFVIDQSPEAGSLLVRGDACVLKLGRRPAAPAGGNRP
jgi:beta-lactam-binding protein with PASTA domain